MDVNAVSAELSNRPEVQGHTVLLRGFVLSWLLFLLFPLSLIIEIIHLYKLLKLHRPLAKFMLLGSSTFVVVCSGVLLAIPGYFGGSAALLASGAPGHENLDRQTRCETYAETCMPPPFLLLGRLSHDYMVRGLAACFGPLRGAYDGPYPDPATAEDYLDMRGKLIDPKTMQSGEIDVEGRHFSLSWQLTEKILPGRVLEWETLHGGEPPTLLAAVYENELLLIQATHRGSRATYLIIAKCGEHIATYWVNE